MSSRVHALATPASLGQGGRTQHTPGPRPRAGPQTLAHKVPSTGPGPGGMGPQTQLLLGWAGVCPDLRSAGRAEAVGARQSRGGAQRLQGARPLNRHRGGGGCQQGMVRREHSQKGTVSEGQPRSKLQTRTQEGPWQL